MSFLFGIAILLIGLWLVGAVSRVDPKALARGLKAGGGTVALAGAAFLAVRGQIGLALPLGLAGLGLLGWIPWGAGLSARTTRRAGQRSRVRTGFLEVELDHDTGVLRGQILCGEHAGKDLAAVDITALAGLLAQVDEESGALLTAYLDRRDPLWREHAQGDFASRSADAVRHRPVTEEEAHQILGLQPGATAEEITRAHRALMKRFHPDQGGSTYLAARINEAKDILLRRHR